VEESDAKEAELIMRFALFKEVPKRQRRKKRKLNHGGAMRKGSAGSDSDNDDDGSDDDGDASGDEDEVPERMSMPPAAAPAAPQDPIWGAESQDVDMAADEPLPDLSEAEKKRR